MGTLASAKAVVPKRCGTIATNGSRVRVGRKSGILLMSSTTTSNGVSRSARPTDDHGGGRGPLVELGGGESQDVAPHGAAAFEPPVLRGIRDPSIEFGEAGDGFGREVRAAIVTSRRSAVDHRDPRDYGLNRRPVGKLPRVQKLERAGARLSLGTLHRASRARRRSRGPPAPPRHLC